MLTTLLVTTFLAAAPQAAVARTTPKPSSTPVRFTATGTFSDGTSRVFQVTADRDSDNDGVSDIYDLSVTCSGGAVSSSVISPRDAASGLATGKRMHKPMMTRADGGVTAMDDWQTRTKGKPVAASWDLATMKGARGMAGPKPIALVEVSPAVCAP